MAKRKQSAVSISPIHPSLHFILFLLMALILIVVVAYAMQTVAAKSRATLVCPQANVDPVTLVEQLSATCPEGVQLVQDQNGCNTWVCNLP